MPVDPGIVNYSPARDSLEIPEVLPENPVRIAVVSHEFPTVEHPEHGRVLYELAKELGHFAEVRVFSAIPRYPKSAFLQPRSYRSQVAAPGLPHVQAEFVEFPVVPLLSRPLNAVSCARCLMPVLERWKPDVLMAFFAYPQGCAAVSISKKLGIPVVLGLRGSDILRISGLTVRRQIRGAMRQASGVTGVSRDLVKHAIAFGADPQHAVTIVNAVREDIFHPSDQVAARRSLGLSNDAEIVLFVGRLVKLKGVNDLLHSTALLAHARPKLQLICVGDGPMEEPWKALAQSLGIADRFTPVGLQSQNKVALWLAASNLLCLPSYSEGSPNVILEALACGRPVVASDVGGIPDMLSEHTGMLLPPGSPDLLATTLAAALDRKWDAHAISQSIRRRWTDVARETFELCARFLPARIGQYATEFK